MLQDKIMMRTKVVVALYPFRAIEGGDLSLEKVRETRYFSFLLKEWTETTLTINRITCRLIRVVRRSRASIGYKICNTRLNGGKKDRCTRSFNGRFYNAVLITSERTWSHNNCPLKRKSESHKSKRQSIFDCEWAFDIFSCFAKIPIIMRSNSTKSHSARVATWRI